MHRGRLPLAFFLAITILSADTVTLKNSDRITGEIVQLEDKSLAVKTSYAGTVKIDWGMIESIISERSFEIETESGLRLRGPLERTPQGFIVATEQAEVAVIPGQVVRMAPVPEESSQSFLEKITGAADFGYSVARGNSNLDQSSLGVNARYRTAEELISFAISSLFSEQLDSPTNSRHVLNLRYDRFLSPASFAFGLTNFERDDRQRLNLRTNLGGGLGWKIIRTDRTTLSLLGGVTFINEKFRPRPDGLVPRMSSAEGLAGFDLEATTIHRIKVLSKMSIHPNFMQDGRYRVVFDSGLRVPLVGRFTWNLSLFDRFDSQPPLRVKRNDYGVISSLGVSF